VTWPVRIARPVVYHAHTRMTPELPTYFEDARARLAAVALGALLDRALPPRADAIAAVSPALADALGGSCVPPALRTEVSERRRRDRGHLVYTGNLDRYQGVPALLATLRELPDVRLTIATASAPGPVAAVAASLGVAERVRFVPHSLPLARALLSRASVVVVPRALATGFPIKLLEAMAAAAPIVVDRRGAHGLTDGVQARVAGEREMPAAIAALLADPGEAEAMGQRARAHVLVEHSVERAARELEGVLQSAVGLRARRPGASRERRRARAVADRDRALGDQPVP